MRQPLLQKASSQSAAICAHSERGDLYHGMQPSGSGRQQRKAKWISCADGTRRMECGPLFLALPGKKDLSRSPFSRCAFRLSAGPNCKTSAIDETSTQAHLSQLRSHCDLLTKSSKCQSSPLTRVRDSRGGVILWRSRIITHWRDETFIPWKKWKFPVRVSTFKGLECKYLPDLQFLYL